MRRCRTAGFSPNVRFWVCFLGCLGFLVLFSVDVNFTSCLTLKVCLVEFCFTSLCSSSDCFHLSLVCSFIYLFSLFPDWFACLPSCDPDSWWFPAVLPCCLSACVVSHLLIFYSVLDMKYIKTFCWTLLPPSLLTLKPWHQRNPHDYFTMSIFSLQQSKIVQCKGSLSGLVLLHSHGKGIERVLFILFCVLAMILKVRVARISGIKRYEGLWEASGLLHIICVIPAEYLNITIFWVNLTAQGCWKKQFCVSPTVICEMTRKVESQTNIEIELKGWGQLSGMLIFFKRIRLNLIAVEVLTNIMTFKLGDVCDF